MVGFDRDASEPSARCLGLRSELRVIAPDGCDEHSARAQDLERTFAVVAANHVEDYVDFADGLGEVDRAVARASATRSSTTTSTPSSQFYAACPPSLKTYHALGYTLAEMDAERPSVQSIPAGRTGGRICHDRCRAWPSATTNSAQAAKTRLFAGSSRCG
jgi:hypothetical protein